MAAARLAELPHELRAKILSMNPSKYCTASKETLASCDQFWVEAVAIEKDYWENQYMVDDVKGVPRDTVRQDMRKFDKRREGFARILDLIRRRDGVELEEDKIPKDVSLKKAYEHLVGAREWAPRHWRANRQAFSSIAELRQAIAAFMNDASTAEFRQAIAAFTNDANGSKQAVINTYGEPEAWIVTNLESLDTLGNSFHVHSMMHRLFNEPIGAWDTSNVKTFLSTFLNFTAFNQFIGAWKTSNVKEMRSTFDNARSFNQPIGNWDVSNVTDMAFMFENAVSFNQPIGGWNTSNLKFMISMFKGARSFNQPIGNWDISKVDHLFHLFKDASAFNQPLCGWNTAKVTNMEQMFQNATAFNQPIGTWNTSNVTTMYQMFYNAISFNQSIGDWDTSKVKIMTRMFAGALQFDQPINAWNTSSLTEIVDMFHNAMSFSHDNSKFLPPTEEELENDPMLWEGHMSYETTRASVVDAVFDAHLRQWRYDLPA